MLLAACLAPLLGRARAMLGSVSHMLTPAGPMGVETPKSGCDVSVEAGPVHAVTVQSRARAALWGQERRLIIVPAPCTRKFHTLWSRTVLT